MGCTFVITFAASTLPPMRMRVAFDFASASNACAAAADFAEPSACTSTVSLRSEEHTSELQSQSNIVCRLLLEKKKLTATGGTGNTLTPPPRTTEPTKGVRTATFRSKRTGGQTTLATINTRVSEQHASETRATA